MADDFMAKAFSASPVGIAVSRQSDGRFLEANAAFLEAVGLSKQELLALCVEDFAALLGAETKGPVAEALRKRMALRNHEVGFTTRFGGARTALASFEPAEIDGVSCVLSFFQDITNRKRAEEARGQSDARLRLSEEQYRVVAATIRDAILTVTDDGTITFLNPTGDELLGYQAGELRGRPITDIMPERFRPKHRAAFARYLSTGERRLNWKGIALIALRKDGREVPVEVSFTEMRLQGQRVFMGVMRDQTERVAAEQFLADVLDIIGHEFRTPVTVIRGYADMMASGNWKPTAAGWAAARERIDLSSKHLAFLLTTVGELAKARAGKFEAKITPVETLGVLLEAIEAMEARRGGRGRSVTVSVDPGAERILADERKLIILLVELIDNAAKFSTAKTPIEVVAQRRGDKVSIAVRDYGPGIAIDAMPHLFNPFFQADMSSVRKAGGAGLGLPLVKALAEAQFGSIEVDPGYGSGATFSVVLPAAPGA